MRKPSYIDEFLLNKNVKVVYRDGGAVRVLPAILVSQDRTFIFFKLDSGATLVINRFAIVKIIESGYE